MSLPRLDVSTPDSQRKTDWLRGLVGLPPVGYRQQLGCPRIEVSPIDSPAGSIQLKIDRQNNPLHTTSSRAGLASAAESRSFVGKVVAEFKAFFFDTKLNLLMVAIPFVLVSYLADWGDGPAFILCMVALIPCAERLGFVTEELAKYTNDALGGLLNATFGNATEVIISVFALRKGLLRVVQLSLLGSIVSNLLLVLGSAFVAGGIVHPMQRFNQQGINVNCALLILTGVSIALPSLLSETQPASDTSDGNELALSRFMAIFLLICYGLYLVFQLFTHRFLYEEHSDDVPRARVPSEDGSRRASYGGKTAEIELMNGASGSVTPLGGPSLRDDSYGSNAAESSDFAETGQAHALPKPEDDEDDDEKQLSFVGCFLWLTVVTVFIAVLSEYLVSVIEGASRSLDIPLPFLTTILLPIVGNAAEHSSAIIFAYRNRIEIALGVAVGSSTQVGVLIVPLCVILAWMMGEPLTLNFNAFEAVTLFVSILLAIVVLQDGYSNWLKGAILIATYVFVSAGFWCHEDPMLLKENVDATLPPPG